MVQDLYITHARATFEFILKKFLNKLVLKGMFILPPPNPLLFKSASYGLNCVPFFPIHMLES